MAEFFTIPELAEIMGLTRGAVYKQVKQGKIKASKIGKNYAIPKDVVSGIFNEKLTGELKDKVKETIKKTLAEYRETLKLLGKE